MLITPPTSLVAVLESTEAVIVAALALLSAITGVLVAFVKGWRWLRDQIMELQQRSGQTLHQVQNDHNSNLRDDVDGLASKLDAHAEKLDKLFESVTRLDERDRQRQDTDLAIYTRLGQLAEQDSLLHNRIDNIKEPP
ncbi:hypothetical protein M3B43_07370 [Nesterenkonia massiliensis]|uniref:DUF2746 domain-containing protein n=1 Tax=Nesterenkonia massiliensis TaxID=1232429 RepID=A0ABT2HR30_9MICC|nr:hypothetical protein [Nesterenkonia massiliensis]MCT1607147.1 hypothetical protein [Nesterenkonia massiliensis]